MVSLVAVATWTGHETSARMPSEFDMKERTVELAGDGDAPDHESGGEDLAGDVESFYRRVYVLVVTLR
jgi:hypothetical protein